VLPPTSQPPGDELRDRGAVTYPLPSGIAVERNVKVRMGDGVHLAATVYRPDREGRFPVVMCVTAYGKDFGPAEYSTLPKIKKAGMAVGTLHISDVTTWEGPDPGFWVPHGYVVVVANARGYYDSEGDAGIYSANDAQDYAALIDWAGVQPWSNGSVGLNGVSYLAINQWMCASLTQPKHLKAIVPWEGATDLQRDAMRPGGIPETRFMGGYYAGSLARGAGDQIIERGPALMERVAGQPFPLENIRVPALVCASWSDHGLHTRGSIEGFARIASPQKWLYTHGGNKWEVYYSAEALEWQKSFFDYFLKGENNGFENRPRVRLETRHRTDEATVRTADAWPPADVRYTPRYLDLANRLLTSEAPADAQSLTYDVASRQTLELDLPFDQAAELTGPMVLKLWVAARNSDDLDIFVAIRKLDRRGQEVHFCGKDGHRQGVVAMGWLRVSERHQDPERSTPWRPYLTHTRSEKVTPGEVIPVDIEILPSSTYFAAGESLRLVISGRDIVEHARFGHDDSINQGFHEIHAGDARPSHLLIPLAHSI
jgi:predicted acyl esterase